MSIEQVILKIKSHPYMLKMGAGKLSKMFNCTRDDVYEAKKVVKEGITYKRLPKILLLDIEIAPNKAAIFRVWKQNVGPDQLLSEWFMLTWSAKWLFDDEVLSDRLTPSEAKDEDDKRILLSIWELLDEADIVIAHNAKYFDIPRINTRFLIENIQQPSTYRMIDTLFEVKKQFDFLYNRLDYINNRLGLGRKLEHGGMKDLWIPATNGSEKALLEMEEYNKVDVEILEELYLRIRPWIKSHPNMGLYMESKEPVCANCGSPDVKPDGKSYYTYTGKYQTYRCSCGALSRVRKSDLDKEVGSNLLVSLPSR